MTKQLTHGSLFAGIGGFDLGFERAGIKTIWQVEIDEYCRRVLARHFPDAERFEDVRQVGAHNLEPVDVLTGGFPCQDISYAGFGAGLDGERSGLWWQMARIVRELEPGIVVVENVAALLERGIDAVLGSLASLGFDAEWSSVSACAMGATHVRQRLFIVAHSNRIERWARLRDSVARSFGPLQTVDGFASSRAGATERLANPSSLYGGANGAPFGSQRVRAIGNSIYPDIAEWIGRRIVEASK